MGGIAPKILLFLIVFGAFGEIHPSSCSATYPIVEIISVQSGKMTFGTWRPDSSYYHNEFISVRIVVRNNEGTNRTAIIYANAFDNLDQPLDTYSGIVTLSGNETKIIYCSLYVPRWAFSGGGRVTATAKTLPEDTFCPEKTDAFYLFPGKASYLTVRTSTTSGEGASDVSIWIDEYYGFAPVTVQLDPGVHTVRIETVFDGCYGEVFYAYTFKHWENCSLSSSRTINILTSTNQTWTAYYRMRPWLFQPR